MKIKLILAFKWNSNYEFSSWPLQAGTWIQYRYKYGYSNLILVKKLS